MPKEEWGTKRLCPTTGKRFYDLGRVPIVSPYTGETVTIDTGKHRTMVADAADAQTKRLETASADSDDDAVVEDDDAEVELEDDLLEDEDDDDVSLDDIADVAADDDES